jgi:hypothetical protein
MLRSGVDMKSDLIIKEKVGSPRDQRYINERLRIRNQQNSLVEVLIDAIATDRNIIISELPKCEPRGISVKMHQKGRAGRVSKE